MKTTPAQASRCRAPRLSAHAGCAQSSHTAAQTTPRMGVSVGDAQRPRSPGLPDHRHTEGRHDFPIRAPVLPAPGLPGARQGVPLLRLAKQLPARPGLVPLLLSPSSNTRTPAGCPRTAGHHRRGVTLLPLPSVLAGTSSRGSAIGEDHHHAAQPGGPRRFAAPPRCATGIRVAPVRRSVRGEVERTQAVTDRILRNPAFDWNAHEMCSYLSQGIYAPLLKKWATRVPRERILVVQSERYFAETAEVAAEVLKFLRLRADPPAAPGCLNGGGHRADIAPEMCKELEAFFAPHNEELFERLGRRFDWDESLSSRTSCVPQTSRWIRNTTAPHPRS